TGFKRLDRAIGGWERGVFYVIAGRPGIGKSHLMLCAALGATPEAPAGIFSLEMSKPQIISRLAYMLAGLNKDDIEQGVFDNKFGMEERAEIQEKTTAAIAEVHELPIWIDDKAGLTTGNITARIERMKAEHNLGAVFIDHLGKIGDAAKSLYEKTTLVSGRLAQMAKDCDVPIVALCQLNREAEGKDRKSDRRPRLSDLRESGAIEQDARVVLGLYRDDYYSETDETFKAIYPGVENLLQVMVLKANERRSGRMIPLEIDPKSRRLRDWPHWREHELKC
ncbi:MAG: DnaB-like helicase C-terminal domain-containing protein, partial [Dehalococcoidia bacterium]|nr:DnaB-like helicase C-terminal domain-containing protein [Dehalococcoidia bacterium]